MSRCVIFCGPSLPLPTIARWLRKAEVRPPAACGDVYRATMQGAVTIGIIDGDYDEAGPVWHKEILWALKQGVFVYGSAGVGALRAAELHRFGMVGVGRIFGWYRDGMINADDEIMVAHGTREDAYRARSDALVNMRATLERAVGAWVISEADAHTLIQVARMLFYPVRTYASLLELAQLHRAVAADSLARLSDWLSNGSEVRVDQKRIDAEAMIRRIASAAHDTRCDGSKLEFEFTVGWDALTRRIATEESAPASGELPELLAAPPVPVQRAEIDPAPRMDPAGAAVASGPVERQCDVDLFAEIDRAVAHGPGDDAQLFTELERASPELACDLLRECVERALSLLLAERHGLKAEPLDVRAASDHFRFEHALLSDAQTEAWLARRGLDVERFSEWMADDARAGKAGAWVRALALRQVRRVYEARVLAAHRRDGARLARSPHE
jgi:hypothetical protein